MKTGYYEVRGLRLAYHEWAPPAEGPHPCVVLIHGFMDHGLSFTQVAEQLGGYRVVAPDVRGHGHSGWVGRGGYYHFYDYFDDMRWLLDALEVDHCGVLGHSMGGSIATGLAALESARVRRLVLLEGMGPPTSDLGESVARLRRWSNTLRRPGIVRDEAERRRARPVMASLEEAAGRLARFNPRLTHARARTLAKTFTEPSDVGPGVVWRMDPLHKTPAAKPFIWAEAVALWRAIEAPVLSLSGAESPWVPDWLEARHAELRAVTRAKVPNAGHNMHHDRPELVAAAVDAWMQDRPLPRELVPHDGRGA